MDTKSQDDMLNALVSELGEASKKIKAMDPNAINERGACCYSDFGGNKHCNDSVTLQHCTILRGVWHEDKACVDIDCT